jgi:hypothetical protein
MLAVGAAIGLILYRRILAILTMKIFSLKGALEIFQKARFDGAGI